MGRPPRTVAPWETSQRTPSRPFGSAILAPGPALVSMIALMVFANISLLLLGLRPGLIYISVGTSAMAIMLLPFVARHDVDAMSPWAIAAASVFVSTLARGAYIAVGWPDRTVIEALFTFDAPPTELLWPATLFLSGLLLAAVGYASRPTDVAAFRPRGVPVLSTSTVWRVAIVGAALSLVAFGLFVLATGGLDLSRLSVKRTQGLADDGTGSLGLLRWVSKFGGLTYLLLVAHLVRRPITLRSAVGGGATLFAAVLLPLYASSRSEALWLIFLTVMVAYYSGRITRRHLAVGVVVFIVALDLMTSARSVQEEATPSDLLSTVPDVAMVDTLVLNRNMVDFSKTARIINNVPEVLPHAHGSSIGVWAVAWIPREVWPGKPTVNAGSEIGVSLFGTQRSGVPPGLFGELYWNFGAVGVVVGGLAFGVLLGRINERFRVRTESTPFEIVLYCYGISRFAYYVMGHSLGFGVFRSLLECLQVLALGFLLRLSFKRPPREVGP